MKKLFGLTIALMLGLNIVGCESTVDDTNEENTTQTKQEEQIEVKEIEETEEVEVEEQIEEEVEEFDEEELNYYLTTSLPEEEYDKYFNSICDDENGYYGSRVIEFDASIDFVDKREGYDTRYELGLSSGDYGELNGPFIKDKDICMTDLKDGMIFGKCNVRVKAAIDEYDPEYGWLLIDIMVIKVIRKYVKKQFGIDIELDLETLDVDYNDGDIVAKASLEIKVNRNETKKILTKIDEMI